MLILGKPNCPYCDRAKQLLDSKDMPYDYIDVSNSPEMQERLASQGIRTVPAIYSNTTNDAAFMGGYNELRDYVRSL